MSSIKKTTELPPTIASVTTPAVREKFYARPFVLSCETLKEVLRISSETGRSLVRKYVLDLSAAKIGIDGEEYLDHVYIVRQTMGAEFERQQITGGKILIAYQEENGFSIKLEQESAYFDMGQKIDILMQYKVQAAEIIQGFLREIDPQAAIEMLPAQNLSVGLMVKLRV